MNSPSARIGARLGHGMWAFPLAFLEGTIKYCKDFPLISQMLHPLSPVPGHGGLWTPEMLFSLYCEILSIKGSFPSSSFFF